MLLSLTVAAFLVLALGLSKLSAVLKTVLKDFSEVWGSNALGFVQVLQEFQISLLNLGSDFFP